jgi:hypothetical protein
MLMLDSAIDKEVTKLSKYYEDKHDNIYIEMISEMYSVIYRNDT